MSGLLSNAISGLRVSQSAMRTAGHNISNANTDGYSRQRTEDVARPEQRYGNAGYMGSGARTESITRVVDNFVTGQLRTDTTNYHSLDKYSTNLEKIDQLFADESTGLSGGLKNFFAALQNGADDPSSSSARQLIISEAESLGTRFNGLYDRLADMERDLSREMGSIAEQVNELSGDVAELNQSIADKSSSGTGGSPNDLLDQRDEKLRELSELVGVQVVPQSDGSVNVSLGQGHSLVAGTRSNELEVGNDGDITLGESGRTRTITQQLNGGQLGGLVDFREGILQTAQNELGRIALVVADTFNEQQQKGLDLDGDYGERLFRDINDEEVIGGRIQGHNNSGPDDRDMTLRVEDTEALTASDYQFEIINDSGNYVITRADNDEVVDQGSLSGGYPQELTFDGLSLTLDGGSFQEGDRFTLSPTNDAARHIESRLSRPEDLAFASPVRTGTDSGNQGTGSISQGEVLSKTGANGEVLPAFAEDGELSPPVIVRFTSETTYDILDNSDPANPKHLEPPIREQQFVPGEDNALFSADPGETRVIGNGERLGLPEGRDAQVVPTGGPAQNNGYPSEQMRFQITDPDTGGTSTRAIATDSNASAANTAEKLSRVSGVSANAFTEANLTDFSFEDTSSPFQIRINGEELVEYDGGNPASDVPDPQSEPEAFQEYLAQRVNDNENLQSLGFRAEAGANEETGELEVRLVASSGVDMDVRLEADDASQNQLSINDGSGNPDVRLSGEGAGNESAVTVGGRVDLTMADGVELETAPSDSQLFGDSRDEDFAQSSFLGYQATIKGQPEAGDTFTVDFNNNASNDNRNALAMADKETDKLMGGGELSLSDAYSRLVEQVGTESGSARSNSEAARSLMEQTQEMRESISGVNLDEEAANLIKFEQAYNANSRVISIARELFDTLLNSV